MLPVSDKLQSVISCEESLLSSSAFQGIDLTGYDDPEQINHLVEVISAGNLRDPFLLQPTVPHLALVAVKQGRLSAPDFSTLMLFLGLKNEPMASGGFTICPFFDAENKVSKVANLLLEYLVSHKADPRYLTISKENKAQIIEKMKGQSALQRQFFWIKNVHDPSNPTDLQNGIAEAIFQTGFNVFLYLKDVKNIWHRIVPSFGMKQIFLDEVFKGDSPKLMPKIGLSSIEDIRMNALTNTRDEYTYFPNVDCPKFADLQPSTPINFNHHDFYHATIAGFIPHTHRVVFAKIYDVILDFSKSFDDPELKKWILEFAERVIDMEHSSYKRLLTQGIAVSDELLTICFLESLSSLPSTVFSRISQTYEGEYKSIESLQKKLQEKFIVGSILKNMAQELCILREEFFRMHPNFLELLEDYNYHNLAKTVQESGLDELSALEILENTIPYSLARGLRGGDVS